MKVRLCYYQIFSLNSDQQTHIVCNLINTFSSIETCNTDEFNTIIYVFSHVAEIKNDQSTILFPSGLARLFAE